MFRLKKLFSFIVCFSLLSAQLTLTNAQTSQDAVIENSTTQNKTEDREEGQNCQTTNETEFRSSIELLILQSLRSQMTKFDYRSAVREEWRKLEIGKTLDGEIDRSIEEIRNEMSWGALLQSLSNSEKARELSVLVAERVYHSEKIKLGIEELATGVGQGLGAHLEMITPDAANPALDCLSKFLGARYGATVSGVITSSARQDFQLGAQSTTAQLSSGSLLKETAGGVTGAAILILRRQLASITQRLGQRIVGSVLSRLVSVVAGSVGLALIAKDLWDLRYGVLPIISEEMKSEESKNKVQEELARSISEQIDVHLKDIAAKSSERIFTIWNEYRAAHTLVLDFASRNNEFRSFLNGVQPQLVPRLDEITALILSSEGEAGVLNRLSNGTLEEAINRIPDTALEIARQTRSIDLAIAWYGVAGNNIDKVLSYELFQRTSPSAFSKESLSKVLSLENPLAVKRLSTVKPEVRDVLFDIEPVTLSEMVRAHDEKDLSVLASYITGLKPSLRQNFLEMVAKASFRFELLKSPQVRDAVLESSDQGAAIEMLMRNPEWTSWSTVKRDFQAVVEGKIKPQLLWYVHPYFVAAGGLSLFVLLLLLRRLAFPLRVRATKKN